MKKIININFHSRVIPIEETAYEILQQYVESLRRYFANEEGRDEIISDIENRFSELFADKLKKGAVCITDEDVNGIIASMGRPEEFEGEPEPTHPGTSAGAGSTGAGSTGAGAGGSGAGAAGASAASGGFHQGYGPYTTADEPRRLYRAGNDKVLGGVCAGLANYLKLDPVVVRLIFVFLFFTGAGFLLYSIMWAILPVRSVMPMPAGTRKRLYRNPDDRVIAGVASGLAAYFHIDVWIPRLIFALPILLGVVTSIFSNMWWHVFRYNGHFIFNGFGGTFFIAYVVLWIVLPEATTAPEKLEMRGEKIDLESIKATVKSDLETLKGRAKEMGAEMSERMQQMGREMGSSIRQGAQTVSSDIGYAARRSGTGVGHAIGVLFKAFFLVIAGLVAFALVMALIGIAFGAFSNQGLIDLKGYVLAGFWQNALAWAAFLLCLVVPVVALLTWLIRRITGMRSQRHYLGYVFATLWVIGIICAVVLAGMFVNNFRARAHTEEDFALQQPSSGNLIIKAHQPVVQDYYDDWWFGEGWRRHGFFYNLGEDSILLNTVQIKVLKSEDAVYHLRILRGSYGSNANSALEHARQIAFNVSQSDSVIELPGGFPITRDQKFR
ncbi:MAG TPA: PspC domain-containing protein, partial [Puia sp.]|nr:PspC domain-containing protein [Puia sp.]